MVMMEIGNQIKYMVIENYIKIYYLLLIQIILLLLIFIINLHIFNILHLMNKIKLKYLLLKIHSLLFNYYIQIQIKVLLMNIVLLELIIL